MGGLLYCGTCCMLLSVWGIIQLTFMGCLFFFEAPILFHEAEPKEFKDYDDFIKKTKDNYLAVAINCWIAAVIYIVTLVISCVCIRSAKKADAKLAKLLEDDEYVCRKIEPETKKKKKNEK